MKQISILLILIGALALSACTGGKGFGTLDIASTGTTTTTTLPGPSAQFSVPSAAAFEAAGSVNVNVVSHKVPDTNITVPYTVTGTAVLAGDHNLALTGTLTINSGQTVTTLTIPLIDDATYEANETVIVTLGTPTGAWLGSNSVYTLTIVDDDTPPDISIAATSAQEHAGTMDFTVTVTPVSLVPITFTYSTGGGDATAGSDYTAASSVSLTIPASTATTTISIPIANDEITETNESFQVTMSNPVHATIGTATAAGMIIDNDLLSVEARYTNAANWNDYVLASNGTTICTYVTDVRARGCMHGGEYKKVSIPGRASCTGLTMTDRLGAFDWTCDQSSGVVFYGLFKSSKGLKDLVNATSWKTNAVDLYENSSLIRYSALVDWWANTVVAAPDSSVAAQALAPNAGTVYVVASNAVSAGYNINRDKMSLVTLPGVKLSRASVTTDNCTVGTEFCMVTSVGRAFLWIEVDVDGYDTTNFADYGLLLNAVKYSQVRQSHFSGAAQGVKLLTTQGIVFKDTAVSKNGNGILYDSAIKGLAVDLKVMGNQTGFAGSLGKGIHLNNTSSENYFINFNVSGNKAEGIVLENTSINNSFVSGILASNGLDGASVTTASNTFHNLTLLHNGQHNLNFATEGGNTLVNSLSYNASSAAQNLLISGNSVGQKVHDFFAGGVNAGNISLSASTNNIFSGKLALSTSSCTASGGTAGLTAGCLASGSSTGLVPMLNFAFGDFIAGKTADTVNAAVDSNGAASFASITDFVNFEKIFRFFGNDGSAFPDTTNAGECSVSGNCQVWDVSIKANSNPARDVHGIFYSSTSCPASASEAITDSMTSPAANTFLTHATEVLEDKIGDGDGLCESNEACTFSPNPGVYQGESLGGYGCVYTNGTVSNVSMRGYLINGAP